jgi:DmsE family decaheme c-type cytochrome
MGTRCKRQRNHRGLMGLFFFEGVTRSRGSRDRDRRQSERAFRKYLIALAWAGTVGFLIGSTSSAAPGEALSSDPALSALRAFVQSIAADETSGAANQTAHFSRPPVDDGDAYSALREFTRIIETEQSPDDSKDIKIAEADNAFDALREFLQKGGTGDQPQSPKASAPKPARAAPKPPPPVDATYVGSKVCLGCHSTQAEAFSHTLMGRLHTQGKLQCETCHGPGSAHVKAGGGRGVGGIISFRADDDARTAQENNGICLGCHERGERTYWDGSVHQEHGLACTDCHTIMKSVSARYQLKTAFQPETCFQCHKDIRAKMLMSGHMPVVEGKIVCSDCHNPHGSFTDAMLRTDSINDTCYKCHAEKRGPFLFEHEPVRENCLNCHDPHGSVNESMLKMSRPRLCFECHTIGPHGPLGASAAPGSDLSMSRSCTDCHTQIHGSNSPAGGAFHR